MDPADAKRLRQELKEWERSFADANGGRKPTRDEIKRDKAIAAKYTAYYNLQPSTSTKAPRAKANPTRTPTTTTTTTPTAIPHDPTNPFAPSLPSSSSVRSTATATTIPSRPTTSTSVSASDAFRTPSKPASHHLRDLFDSPLSSRGRRLFGNRPPRDSVGPTPQKTGKVLGIFESFADLDADEATPFSSPQKQAPPPRPTPSKSGGGGGGGGGSSKVAVSPAFLTTPRKRKAGEVTGTPRTPATQRDVFSTPAFLRRSFIASLEESPEAAAAAGGPRRRPQVVKGLSTMVAELRRLEDDAYHDDEEALREAEGGGRGEVVAVVVPANDPETGLPPLPDGAWREEGRVDEEEEEGGSGDEKGGKRRWKKKGLKRQHRRVIMRPVGKTTTTTAAADEAEGEDAAPPPNPAEAELPGAGYSDEDLSDLDNLPDGPSPPKKKKPVEKKSTRKVSERAHANYRRLNIRGSKGAKATGGGGGGRFARKKR